MSAPAFTPQYVHERSLPARLTAEQAAEKAGMTKDHFMTLVNAGEAPQPVTRRHKPYMFATWKILNFAHGLPFDSTPDLPANEDGGCW